MSKILHESHTDTGVTRIVEDSKGNIRIDSYFGDITDPKETKTNLIVTNQMVNQNQRNKSLKNVITK